MISKSDFLNWKQDPVTKAFYEAIVDRITEAKDVLSYTAGMNPSDDNFNRGLISAYREALDFRVESIDGN